MIRFVSALEMAKLIPVCWAIGLRWLRLWLPWNHLGDRHRSILTATHIYIDIYIHIFSSVRAWDTNWVQWRMSGVTRAIDKNPCESYGFGSTSGTSSWMPKEVWQCVWARMIMGQLELIGVEIRLDCLWRSFGLSSPDTACWFDAVQDMQISILQLLLWRRTWLQWCRETRIIFALTGKVSDIFWKEPANAYLS